MKAVISQYLVTDDLIQDLRQSFPGVTIQPTRTTDEEQREQDRQ